MTGILQRLLALSLLVSPTLLFALGLGDIRLNSALNEPLSAEIELLGASSDELDSLSAALASREAFARYGVEQFSHPVSLEFKTGRSSDGRDVLRVTSREPIGDPFLTWLVEVNWSRGRLLREYTVLLDPPVYLPQGNEAGEQSTGVPVSAPQTTSKTDVTRSGTIQRPAESSPEAPSVVESGNAPTTRQPQPSAGVPPAGGAYTVRSNDTLWQIASGLRPGSAREVNRMMVALYRANPDAFAGNINNLRAGSILRAPDSAAVDAISAGEAGAEVRRQYADWRAAHGSAPSESGTESARLRLVTPTERGQSAAGATDAPPAPAPATGQPRDAQTSQAENAESRRLLELKDAELARLQQQLGQPTPEAAVPATEAPPPQATPESALPPVSEQPTPPAAKQAPPKTEAAPTTEQSAIVDWLEANWYFPLAALLILGGLVFALIRRRNEPDFDTLGRLAVADADSIERDLPLAREPITARVRAPKEEEDSFLVEESGEHEQPPQFKPSARPEPVRAAPGIPEPVAAPKTADDTLSSETAINLDQGDPLAEADFHMAYGLYDQAADLVRIAIEREPQRRDLRLKLLEIFFVWGNKDAFLQAARQLNDTRDQAAPGEWDKIVIMGKQIAPEDPLFARASGSGAASGGGVDLSLETGEHRVDLNLTGSSDGSFDNSGRVPADLIDLDFSDALDENDTSDTGKSPALHAEDAGLDFMLDEPQPGSSDEDASGGTTREMTARTQELPTIETPQWRSDPDAATVETPAPRNSSTIREKVDSLGFRKESRSPEQTAELALDDLGLDIEGMPAAEDDPSDALDHPDDAATMLASSLRPANHSPTGTWILDEEALTATFPAKSPGKGRAQSGGELKGSDADEMDLDLDQLEAALVSETARQPRHGGAPEEQFSSDVFTGSDDLTSTDIDLDIGEARQSHDREPTKTERIPASEMELPELEPVTMSEVGTKLDLARAYMDMGDPEGARSILDEVLAEGSPTQKQEAQRLIDSLP